MKAQVTISTDGSKDRKLRLAVENRGPLIGDAVVLAFLVPVSLPTQPGSKLIQRLFDFVRLPDIAIGASAMAELELSAEALAMRMIERRLARLEVI